MALWLYATVDGVGSAREIERLTEATTGIVTVDGCGAPLLGMPLSGLARSFGLLATAEAGTAERRVADAMRLHPELVGGKGAPSRSPRGDGPGSSRLVILFTRLWSVR